MMQNAHEETKKIQSTPTKLEVPVYIFAGRQDYQTPSPIAKKYFDVLECPYKEFVWFEHSAHLLNFEEPEKFYQECLKIKKKLA
jgi:pimeloyl-ACP methyl ester carboxylesterase